MASNSNTDRSIDTDRPIYVIAYRWIRDDPAKSVRALATEWLWRIAETSLTRREKQLLSALDLDFLVLHAGFERAMVEAGLPSRRIDIPEALKFIKAIGAQRHLALYEQALDIFESVFRLNRTDVRNHNIADLFLSSPDETKRFSDELSPLHARAYELDRARPLSDFIWVAVDSWDNLKKVDEYEFDLRRSALKPSGATP